ncbi:MAG: hypothetical protein CMM15_03875 [Rhodospirillaceae bacterium]|nr:hypothetical protein [Rhodospirillaceae bacterium]|tara:strand:+ start:3120 stop:4580 length:1461 start_codon:yes stop_codon:yes gene_type:complete
MWLTFYDPKINCKGYGIGRKYGGFLSCRGKFVKIEDTYVPDGKVTLRFNFQHHLFLGGDTDKKNELPSNRFFKYQLKNITNTPSYETFDMPSFTFHRSVAASVFLRDHIYLIGGFDGNQSISHVERFSVLTGEWEICSSLAQRRSSLSAIPYQGRILVFGGLQCNHCFSIIESYDPDKNAWNHCGDLKYGRSGANLVEIMGKVYIFGGLSNTRELPPLEIYDIAKNKTKVYSTIRVNRSSFGIVHFRVEDESYIFLAGGSDNRNEPLSECLLYNVANNTIEAVPPMHYRRKYPNVVFEKDKVYVYGGHDGNTVISDCEIYYTKQKRWRCIRSNFPYCGCNMFVTPIPSLVEFQAFYRKGVLEGDVFRNRKYYGRYLNQQRHGRFLDTDKENFFYHGRLCSEKTYHQLSNLQNYPKIFECPISLQLMLNPYVTSCGQTYEKAFIEQWLHKSRMDPCTRQSLQPEIYPNHTLQQIIKEFLSDQQIYLS